MNVNTPLWQSHYCQFHLFNKKKKYRSYLRVLFASFFFGGWGGWINETSSNETATEE